MPGHTGAHGASGYGPVGTASPGQADRDNQAMRDRQRERMRDPVQAQSEISRTRQSQDAVNRAMKDMANRGIVQTAFGPLRDQFGNPVQAPGVTANAMARIDRLSRSIMNPQRERTSFGDVVSGIVSSLSPQRAIGSLIGGALFGPIGSFFGGLIGGTYGDDEPGGFFGDIADSIRTDLSNIIGNPVPNFGELNTTTEIGDTFTMPKPSGLIGTTVFGTMPRVTAAPIDSVSQPTNAVDSFGNPVTFGKTSFDPVVETQPIDSVLSVLTRDLPVMDDAGMLMSMEDVEKDLDRIRSQPKTVFNTPIIDAPIGIAPVDPLNPEMGVIVNDPSLAAPNTVTVDPITGAVVPGFDPNLSPGFSI